MRDSDLTKRNRLMTNLSTETWFITGASSSFGEAFARYAIQKGYNVAITARRLDKLQVIAALAPDRVLVMTQHRSAWTSAMMRLMRSAPIAKTFWQSLTHGRQRPAQSISITSGTLHNRSEAGSPSYEPAFVFTQSRRRSVLISVPSAG